jgi:membrane protein implicated in regulation of membrane protease activity
MDDLKFVFWHWFAFAAVLGSIEILAPGIFFLWLALAAFVTGVIVLLLPDMSAALQITTFGTLAVVMVWAAWKFLKKNPIASDQPLLNQRSAQFVGKLFTLEEAIRNGVGRVRIGDSTWKVEGPDMAAGGQVRVVAFNGAMLTVEKVSDAAPVTAAAPVHEGDPRIDPLKDVMKDPLNKNAN